MAPPAVALLSLLSLALIALAPAAAAEERLDAKSCVDLETESDEGPVKAGQEDPGVFVGAPVGSPAQASTDADRGDKYTGAGVFYRKEDCEFPAVAVLSDAVLA